MELTVDTKSYGGSNILSSFSLQRIQKDFDIYQRNPIDGVHVFLQQHDISIVHVLMIGPKNSPYDGGFYCFEIRFPPRYPFHPPNVSPLYNGDDNVAPHIFDLNGKLCISMLNEDWSPAHFLSSIVTIIRSRLFGNDENLQSKEQFNAWRHECLRIAVCDFMEKIAREEETLSHDFVQAVRRYFCKNYESFISDASAGIELDGDEMSSLSLTNDTRQMYAFEAIKERLEAIRDTFIKRINTTTTTTIVDR